MFGAVTSVTVKVVVQVDELLAASVTVMVTFVVPVPTSVPAAGDWVITMNLLRYNYLLQLHCL
jgi:hypothetical protein